jgi:acyl-CoA dehydrogenase
LIPVEYGGLGLTMEEEVLVCFELGQTSPAFRSVIGTNVGIGSQGVVMFGRDDQKKEWLPKLASGLDLHQAEQAFAPSGSLE